MKRNLGIDLLKTAAMLMIMNFHSGRMYPAFKFLATGGDIGNAVFFFVSGILLYSSVACGDGTQRGNIGADGVAWYVRRISRIIPSLLCWSAVSCLLGSFTSLNVDSRIFSTYSALTGGAYWFIRCILVYYIAYWIVIRFFAHRLGTALFVILLALLARYCQLVIICNEVDPFAVHLGLRDWIGFPYMLIGGMVAKNTHIKRTKAFPVACATVIMFMAYFAIHYFAMHRKNFHSLILAYNGMLMVCCVLLYILSQNERLNKILRVKFVMVPVCAISSLTLELYVCHFTFITDAFNNLFPLNIVVFMLLSFGLAYVIKVLSRVLRVVISPTGNSCVGIGSLFRIP